ncbi:MAG: hypothetical protein ACKO7W_23745 [Elainella sp.]
MSEPFFQQIVPLPQAEAEEVLLVQQASHDFFAEVRFRQAFDAYCEYYQQMAEQHRRELEAMRNDINVLGWFGSW